MDADAFDLRRYISRNPQSVAVWIALVALIGFGLLRYDNFGGAYNITSFLNYNSMFIVISIGMCFVIMTGGIDLSVGSVAAFTSVIAAYLSPHGIEVALPPASSPAWPSARSTPSSSSRCASRRSSPRWPPCWGPRAGRW